MANRTARMGSALVAGTASVEFTYPFDAEWYVSGFLKVHDERIQFRDDVRSPHKESTPLSPGEYRFGCAEHILSTNMTVHTTLEAGEHKTIAF